MCGCSNTPPKESFCHLCQDKSPLPDPDKTIYGYPGTCADLQEDAAWNFWQTLHPQEELSSCNFYHHTGSLCGCPNNEPPKDGCDLCFDGNPPLLPDKAVTPFNAAESTCESYALYNKYLHTKDSDVCTRSQSIVGSYCGCSQIPRHTDRCNICPDGYVPKAETWAPDMEVISGNRIFTFKDATCIKVAMLMADYEFPCSAIPEGFVEVCCESAVGMLSSEVFSSSNWINRTKPPLDYSTFTFFPSSSTKLSTNEALRNLVLLLTGISTLVTVML
jgi:hypothetical protein